MGVFATQLGAEGEFNQNISKEPTAVPGTRRLKECLFSSLNHSDSIKIVLVRGKGNI